MTWSPIQFGERHGPRHCKPDVTQEQEFRRKQEAWLTRMAIPPTSWYLSAQRTSSVSHHGDSRVNHTVWIENLRALGEFALHLGFPVEFANFLDIGSGVGIASIYAVSDFTLPPHTE